MGKLVITEECLVPRRLTYVNYKGPDPLAFLKDFKTTLRFIFEVSTTRCMERKLLWDYTGDPLRFYSEWWLRKEMSRFSNMRISIRVIGHVYKTKNSGDFSLELYGVVEHKFEPSNWLTKYVWLLYNYMFYNQVRENQVVRCRNYIQAFLNWVKEKYNLPAVTTPEASAEAFRDALGKVPAEPEMS